VYIHNIELLIMNVKAVALLAKAFFENIQMLKLL